MRALALDIGDRRIGVALSDPTGLIATPLTTINRRSEAEDIEAVLALVLEHEAGEIVVGMPLLLSGRAGPQTQLVSRFARTLARLATVPVETITTSFHIPKTTHDLLRSVAFKRAKERGGRASVSAVLTEMVEANRAELEKEAGPFL